MKSLRRIVLLVGFAAGLISHNALAQSSAFPSKPITFVVAYPAGGDNDVIARMFGEKLSARLGQPVIVENRTGAGGTIGTSHVAKSPADGYTLLFAPNTLVISPWVLKPGAGVPYDAINDLTPIIELGTQSLYVVATAATGATSLKDLVACIHAKQIQTYASPGNGSPMHILGELFAKSANISLTQVPYRGSVPAVADMVGGHVSMMYTTLGPVSQHIATGKLVALGVADQQRSPFLPKVPTLSEQGFKNAEMAAWQSVVGPKGMPVDLVKLLNGHFNEIMKMPDVQARLTSLAVVPVGGDPEKLARLIASDYARYAKLVKEFGIQAD